MSKVYTPEELARYDGVKKEQIYLSVRHKIYDVSDGKDFYGPGNLLHSRSDACLCCVICTTRRAPAQLSSEGMLRGIISHICWSRVLLCSGHNVPEG